MYTHSCKLFVQIYYFCFILSCLILCLGVFVFGYFTSFLLPDLRKVCFRFVFSHCWKNSWFSFGSSLLPCSLALPTWFALHIYVYFSIRPFTCNVRFFPLYIYLFSLLFWPCSWSKSFNTFYLSLCRSTCSVCMCQILKYIHHKYKLLFKVFLYSFIVFTPRQSAH